MPMRSNSRYSAKEYGLSTRAAMWSQFPLVTLHTKYDAPTTGQQPLGKGGYGEVFVMESTCSVSRGTLVAVKKFKPIEKETVEDYVDRVFWEFTLGLFLVHENINQTMSLHYGSEDLHQVMKYCPRGTLRTILRSSNPPSRLMQELWAKQLLRGVGFLHDQGIAHRDIKPENLLLGEDGLIKIIDFGLAYIFEGHHPGLAYNQMAPLKSLHLYAGTKPYLPPERFIQGCDFDYTKQDVWSCGVTLLVFAGRGESPWARANPQKDAAYKRVDMGWSCFLENRKKEKRRFDLFDRPHCGPIFEKLPSRQQEYFLLRMLHPRPKHRISIKEALEDQWIKTIPDHPPSGRGNTITWRRR